MSVACTDRDGGECNDTTCCRTAGIACDENTKCPEPQKCDLHTKTCEFHVSNAVFETSALTLTEINSATECQKSCDNLGCAGWSFDPVAETCDLIREEDLSRALVYKKGGSVGTRNCTIEVSPSECIVSNAVYETPEETRKVNSITDCWHQCKSLDGCVGWSFNPDDEDKTCDLIREGASDRPLVYKNGGSVGTVNCAPPESTPCPPDDAPAKHTCTCTAETLTGKCKNNEICREYASTDITLCTEDSKDIPGVDDEESSDTTLTQCLQKYKTARLGHWQHTKYNDCKKINNTYPSYCGYYPEVKKCCPDTCAV